MAFDSKMIDNTHFKRFRLPNLLLFIHTKSSNSFFLTNIDVDIVIQFWQPCFSWIFTLHLIWHYFIKYVITVSVISALSHYSRACRPKCKGLVVAYGMLSLTRIESQGVSSKKRSGHIDCLVENLLHALTWVVGGGGVGDLKAPGFTRLNRNSQIL